MLYTYGDYNGEIVVYEKNENQYDRVVLLSPFHYSRPATSLYLHVNLNYFR